MEREVLKTTEAFSKRAFISVFGFGRVFARFFGFLDAPKPHSYI